MTYREAIAKMERGLALIRDDDDNADEMRAVFAEAIAWAKTKSPNDLCTCILPGTTRH
jgi:hypothetical protein